MRYLFENFELDTDQRELRRDGVVVPVEPLTFDILALLIRERERVVSKEDLRTQVWGGRVVSDSTTSAAITAVRAAVGDNGEAQRLIRTVPRRGFRFVGTLRDADAPAAAVDDGSTQAPPPPRPARTVIIVGGVCVLVLAVGLGILLGGAGFFRARPAHPFDAATVPLLHDEARRGLATYPRRPDAKAIALATDTLGVADGAVDEESAKREALRLCAVRTKQQCRIYAVGMDVLWSDETMPVPAAIDLHTAPLSEPLKAEDIPTLGAGLRQWVAGPYGGAPGHKALAIATGVAWGITERTSAEEAIRMAVQQCSFAMLRPCMLVSVDDLLTIRMPKTHNATGIFLPSTDPEVPAGERARIAAIYRDADWRAVARGSDGTWHAVAGLASEDRAADAVLQACQSAGRSCTLFAVSNFRIRR